MWPHNISGLMNLLIWSRREVKIQDAITGYVTHFPVSRESNILLRNETGPYRNRVAVIAIPKAGTYMIGYLLRLLGYVDTEIHVWKEGFSDYRDKTLEQKRRNYLEFTTLIPLRCVVPMVRKGQFIVGHLVCDDEVKACLKGFKNLFVYRDLRDSVVSHMRFFAATDRGGDKTQAWKKLENGPEKLLRYLDHLGPTYFAMCKSMIGCYNTKVVLGVSFEKIYGDYGKSVALEQLSKITDYLEISSGVAAPPETLQTLIGAQTKTWSGARTNRSTFWSTEVEQRFAEFGGVEINKQLGYLS